MQNERHFDDFGRNFRFDRKLYRLFWVFLGSFRSRHPNDHGDFAIKTHSIQLPVKSVKSEAKTIPE